MVRDHAVPYRRRRTARHRDQAGLPVVTGRPRPAGLSRDRYQGGRAGPPEGQGDQWRTGLGDVAQDPVVAQQQDGRGRPQHQPQPAALRLADDDRSVHTPRPRSAPPTPATGRPGSCRSWNLDRRRPLADLLTRVYLSAPAPARRLRAPSPVPGSSLTTMTSTGPSSALGARHAPSSWRGLRGRRPRPRRSSATHQPGPSGHGRYVGNPPGVTKVGGEVGVRHRLCMRQRHHLPVLGHPQPPAPISATGAEQRGQPTRRDMRHTVLRRDALVKEAPGVATHPSLQHDRPLALEAPAPTRVAVLETQHPAVRRRQAEPARRASTPVSARGARRPSARLSASGARANTRVEAGAATSSAVSPPGDGWSPPRRLPPGSGQLPHLRRSPAPRNRLDAHSAQVLGPSRRPGSRRARRCAPRRAGAGWSAPAGIPSPASREPMATAWSACSLSGQQRGGR